MNFQLAPEAKYILLSVVFLLVILRWTQEVRLSAVEAFLGSSVPGSIPSKSYNLFQNPAELWFR